ncbi:MAG: hypothetical protein V4725_14255 [Bacteroidota bacterium]
MAKQKNTPVKAAAEKNILTKIAGKVGYIAGGIAGRKDHLMEMAGDAIESVKSTLHDMTTSKKLPKKTAPKAAVKAPAKKAAAPAKKKTPVSATKKAVAPVKKAAKAVKAKVPVAGKKAAGKK